MQLSLGSARYQSNISRRETRPVKGQPWRSLVRGRRAWPKQGNSVQADMLLELRNLDSLLAVVSVRPS